MCIQFRVCKEQSTLHVDKQSCTLLNTLIASEDPPYEMVNLPQYRFSLTLTHIHTHDLRALCLPFADLLDDRDVGEEVMVLCGRHRFPQSLIILEVTHQDAQAVHVRML